ncbi:MAG: hypothetical protein B6D56_05275 [Candidatus Omnitrophica bacterium 4484_70.1]|nr:MAG: hypothetical protein B6D56_05275 [Candidatus Omnitrophica bacterium 4484_70.1]
MKRREKNEKLIKKRKNQILDAAEILFSKYGFSKTTTDKIMQLAKLGKGTIYRYFKNKKDIFFAVIDRGLDRLKEEMSKNTERIDDVLKRIEAAVKTYLSFFEKNADLVNILLYEQAGFQERIAKRYLEHYYGNIDKIKTTFKEGISQKLIKNIDIETATGILTSILNGLIYKWRIEGKKFRLTQKTPLILKIFFTGIVKDKKRRKEYENL